MPRTRTPTRPAAALAAVLALAASAGAQAPGQRPQPGSGLVPVEQTVGDVGPLRHGLRLAPVDLRSPSGFDNVYRLPGSSHGVPGGIVTPGDQLVRANGAVTAVFSRSQYSVTKSGLLPDIPAGTVFRIGRLPLAEPPPPRTAPGLISMAATSAVALSPVSTRVMATRVLPIPEHAPPPTSVPTGRAEQGDRSLPAPGLFEDEGYRRLRTRALLHAAVASAIAAAGD